MAQWEYSKIYIKDEDYGEELDGLNEAGAEGWEFTGHVADTGFGMVYFMKREISDSVSVVQTFNAMKRENEKIGEDNGIS